MLEKFEARNIQGSMMSFTLDDVTSGVIVEDIQGLDPVKATIVSSSFAGVDGVQYQSSRREARNILIKLGLEPDFVTETVEDVRRRLYKFFMPKRPVDLKFYDTNGLVVDISGRVESCDAPIFVQEPQADISIMCFDSDFVDLTPVEISGTSTSTTTETLITYDGSIETGIQFVLNVNRTLSEFTIYHRPPDGSIRSLDFSAPLIAGDVLTISTVTGAKGATLNRGGTENSILYGISPQSNWIQLEEGDNHIRVYAEGAGIPYEIQYINLYGGL